MRNKGFILLLVIGVISLLLPWNVNAVENELSIDNYVADSNESDGVVDTLESVLNQGINVDLLESQSYDYDENDNSILNEEIINQVQQLLDDNNITYDDYSFVADFLESDSFDYTGCVYVYQNDSFVESIDTTVSFMNTDSHIDYEQEIVNDFLDNNSFDFEEDISLDNDENVFTVVQDKVSQLASNYSINCKSMLPPHVLTDHDFPFICFYNNKFYGTLTANIRRNVLVPVSINNNNNYSISNNIYHEESTGSTFGYRGVYYQSYYTYVYEKNDMNDELVDDIETLIVDRGNINKTKSKIVSSKKNTKSANNMVSAKINTKQSMKINWYYILKITFIFASGMWFGGVLVFLIKRKIKKRIIQY